MLVTHLRIETFDETVLPGTARVDVQRVRTAPLIVVLALVASVGTYCFSDPFLNARDLLSVTRQSDLAKGMQTFEDAYRENEVDSLTQNETYTKAKSAPIGAGAIQKVFESFIISPEEGKKPKSIDSVEDSVELADILRNAGGELIGDANTLLSQFPAYSYRLMLGSPAVALKRNGWKYDGASSLMKSGENFSILLGLDTSLEKVVSIYYEVSDVRKYKVADMGVLLDINLQYVYPENVDYRGAYMCATKPGIYRKKVRTRRRRYRRVYYDATVCLSEKSPRKWITIKPKGM